MYQVSQAPGPFEEMQNTYLNVIGEYILKITLDKETKDRIEEFFTGISTIQELSLGKSLYLLEQKSLAKVTLEKNAVKAARIERKFKEYFGL